MPRYPSLYQINTRVWLNDLRAATLDDIKDGELDLIAALGFDWVWLLSVWQIGKVGQKISRSIPELRKEFQNTLPDLREDDIEGSGFAIANYVVSTRLGGDDALARLRKRLQDRGLKLMLDFVPNHSGIDNIWVQQHPEYYVQGDQAALEREPHNYTNVDGTIFAHGRDPYFPGWPDTLQLNYANDATQEAMTQMLLKISQQCDGVRCDMAMLLLPEIFERTWGKRPKSFWDMAIQRVRKSHPEFCFMAEVYWDLEYRLQQLGFDYAYDKRLYDRLVMRDAQQVRGHLHADTFYQNKLARFLENHDEPRAAATFPDDVQKAAATIAFLVPGLRFFHQGQLEGKKKKISPHLIRGPFEPPNMVLLEFYARLLNILKLECLRNGNWRLLDCAPAWDGNWTNDCWIAFSWIMPGAERLIVTINFSDHQSQCYVKLPDSSLRGKVWKLEELLTRTAYTREGDHLTNSGLFLDEPAWRCQIFSLREAT